LSWGQRWQTIETSSRAVPFYREPPAQCYTGKLWNFGGYGCQLSRFWCVLLLSLVVFSNEAQSQSSDFLHPQQKGPFQVNGLSYVEFQPTGYTDPVQIGYPVPTIDQIIAEIKATGTNLVKITLSAGQVKKYTDNAYDPAIPFPLDGKSSDILAFGRKLTSQGIPCLLQLFASVENIVAGATLDTSRVNPTDPRAFIMQHIPRLVSLAQLAEGMVCEYYSIFGDEIEQLVANPNITDLWVQAITQVRQVFSGRIICAVGRARGLKPTPLSPWSDNRRAGPGVWRRRGRPPGVRPRLVMVPATRRRFFRRSV